MPLSFSQFKLSDSLLQAIVEQGYTTPTAVQKQVIPLILEKRDVRVQAPTGSGKTASFVLPILQHLLAVSTKVSVRVLIMTPTRELALQTHQAIQQYGRYLSLLSIAVVGGVSMQTQVKQLETGVDILVATPGRLLDLLNQKKISLAQLQYLVIDEADQMLAMGFIQAINRLLKLMPSTVQSLLFSATYQKETKQLASRLLHQPAIVDIKKTQKQQGQQIIESVYAIKREYKPELLSWLINNQPWSQVLIFVRSKQGAERLSKQLIKEKIRSATLHSDKTQTDRNKVLNYFKTGKITALIATDIAARGLDIKQLPVVVNFNLPDSGENYIHRVGRTGRIDAKGYAISLVAPEEAHLLFTIEKYLNRKIYQVADTGYEKVLLVKKSSLKTKQKTPHRRRKVR